MSISIDYIVYLWLLPVILFIIIPLLMLLGWTAVKVVTFMTSSPKQVQEEKEQVETGLQPSNI